ncbi:MAG: nucleotidyltransferase domain-containing protein [Bacteroidetes bacterium]|jgi:predicted nucleotidyltransferase|nr:nucleotidyltransferase domain-containing protein [Bacteroidota bacterium]
MATVTPLKEALSEAKERLQAIYGGRLVRVILYGSRARGDASPDSDVDVLVVLRSPVNLYAEYKRLSELWAVLFERYRLDFSFHPYDEETYQDLRRPFLRHVHAEGVELLESS